MKCPKCQSEGPFYIVISQVVRMHDDGSDLDYGSPQDWDDGSYCECADSECSFNGIVEDFRND